jgi:hypothetical protein
MDDFTRITLQSDDEAAGFNRWLVPSRIAPPIPQNNPQFKNP